MIKEMSEWVKGRERDFLLFLVAGAFIGIAVSVDGSTLTNYLKERVGMVILQRSALEFPRELPGLLVVVVIGLLSFLGDVRIGVVANIIAAVGMFSLGIIPPTYIAVVFIIFIYSMGQHIFMPIGGSIAMSFAKPGEVGKVLGRLAAVNNIAVVLRLGLPVGPLQVRPHELCRVLYHRGRRLPDIGDAAVLHQTHPDGEGQKAVRFQERIPPLLLAVHALRREKTRYSSPSARGCSSTSSSSMSRQWPSSFSLSP